jgi:hypothetical protein
MHSEIPLSYLASGQVQNGGFIRLEAQMLQSINELTQVEQIKAQDSHYPVCSPIAKPLLQ